MLSVSIFVSLLYKFLFYRGVHSPSDVLSPFSQKISSERNSALKKYQKLHVIYFLYFRFL